MFVETWYTDRRHWDAPVVYRIVCKTPLSCLIISPILQSAISQSIHTTYLINITTLYKMSLPYFTTFYNTWWGKCMIFDTKFSTSFNIHPLHILENKFELNGRLWWRDRCCCLSVYIILLHSVRHLGGLLDHMYFYAPKMSYLLYIVVCDLILCCCFYAQFQKLMVMKWPI